MLVSNSTGQNTDYRVGASSGGTACTVRSESASMDSFSVASPATVELFTDDSGRLPPGGSETCKSSGSCTVEFVIDGKVVASESFADDPGQVILVEKGGQYFIQVQTVDTAAA